VRRTSLLEATVGLFDSAAFVESELFAESCEVEVDLDFPLAVLETLFPATCVNLAICPGHPSFAISQIMLELALIDMPIWPLVDPVSTSLILDVLPFEFLPIGADPPTFPLSPAKAKFPSILIPIAPQIVPKALRLVLLIFASVDITRVEKFEAFPLSDKDQLFFLLIVTLLDVAAVDRVIRDEPVCFMVEQICVEDRPQVGFGEDFLLRNQPVHFPGAEHYAGIVERTAGDLERAELVGSAVAFKVGSSAALFSIDNSSDVEIAGVMEYNGLGD
jgi:hypothetical protein